MATLILDIWPSGGVYPYLASLRNHLGSNPNFQPQAHLRLLVHGFFGHSHRIHGLGRVGAPHVYFRIRPYFGFGIQPLYDVYRRANWNQNSQLASHYVGRAITLPHADALCCGCGGDVYDRRAFGRNTRRLTSRHPTARHLLHRGALPLCDLRRGVTGAVGRSVFLVAQSVRTPLGRKTRQSQLLDTARGLQPYFRADAHLRTAGDVEANPHIHPRRRLHSLECRSDRGGFCHRCWRLVDIHQHFRQSPKSKRPVAPTCPRPRPLGCP